MPMSLQTKKIRLDLVNAGLDPHLIDVKSHMDSTLSFTENRKNMARIFNYNIGAKQTGPNIRGNTLLRDIDSFISQSDDYWKNEKRKKAAAKRKTKPKTAAKTVSKSEFKKMKQLSLYQSDGWYPTFPTKKQDEKFKAKPPGRRRSKSGKIYIERRRNRSDMPGTRT